MRDTAYSLTSRALLLTLLAVALLFAGTAQAQSANSIRVVADTDGDGVRGEVEDLPAADASDDLRQRLCFWVEDPDDDSDCSLGGGSADPHICCDNGVDWVAVPGTGGGGGGDSIEVNGAAATNANFIDSSTVTFSLDTGATPDEVEAVCVDVTCTNCLGPTEVDGGALESEIEAVADLQDLQGVLTAAKGGTGQDSSGSTGHAKVASGTWSFSTPTVVVPLTPALCQGSTAYLTWNTTTSGSPAAACATGSNTQQAYADFDQTSDECLQGSFLLPSDWTGAIDVEYVWLTSATSGSVAWCTQVVCVADAETGDPSFPAQASGNCVSDAAKGTTLQFNTASDTGITATGCAASEVVYFRMCRDPDETGGQTDTVAADARLRDANLILRRTI